MELYKKMKVREMEKDNQRAVQNCEGHSFYFSYLVTVLYCLI